MQKGTPVERLARRAVGAPAAGRRGGLHRTDQRPDPAPPQLARAPHGQEPRPGAPGKLTSPQRVLSTIRDYCASRMSPRCMLPGRGGCHLAVAQTWLAPRPVHRDLIADPRDCRATRPAEACGNGCADVRREDRIVTTAADALVAVWPDVKIEAGDYGTADGWIDRFYEPPGLVQLLQSWQTAVTAGLDQLGHPAIFAPVDLTSAHGLPGAADVAVHPGLQSAHRIPVGSQ
jgi:hypothetical protein